MTTSKHVTIFWGGGVLAMLTIFLLLLNSNQAHASYYGRYGFSGNPATNGGQTCTSCHQSTGAPTIITLDGPTTVQAGETNIYTATVTGGAAQFAGLSISAEHFAGTFTPQHDDLYVDRAELLHTLPKAFADGAAVFEFSWTAPEAAQMINFYSAANSADGNFNLLGDSVGTLTQAITVLGDVTPTPTPLPAASADAIHLDLVAGDLDNPVVIAHTNDARLFIGEQTGRVRVINESGNLLPTPLLDISSQVNYNGSEMGLLGLAFHPEYATNGFFYVNYILSEPDRTRVSRFTVAADSNTADLASETIILEFLQPNPNHNAGDIHFGPDNYLYIASGDGGENGDPDHHAQNPENLLGAILRIDVDKTSEQAPDCDVSGSDEYTIPYNNAYADGADGNCDEVWAMGFRNPWRFSFDPATGDMWIADVGQNDREEINVVPANRNDGLNFGWPCYEGVDAFDLSDCLDQSAYEPPVFDYGRDEGCSITGGYVYRGARYPNLYGQYLYSDFCDSTIRALSGSLTNLVQTSLDTLTGDIYTVSSFGVDNEGELYMLNLDEGSIYRIRGPHEPAFTPEPTAESTQPAATPAASGQQPYPNANTPPTLPTRIEAENYDAGGSNVAYADEDEGNTAGDYRSDDVDIEATSDIDGNYHVGWMIRDEWLAYTVNVTPGIYNIHVRIASPIEPELALSLDGQSLGIARPTETEDWDDWETVTLENITIAQQGVMQLRVDVMGDDANFNWIEFERVDAGALAVDVSTASTAKIPFGTIIGSVIGLMLISYGYRVLSKQQ